MSEDGYTLVEMLVAVGIVGLAFGGLSESARVLGRLQAGAASATADARVRGTAQRALTGLLNGAGPFVSTGAGGFNGSSSGFSFACGQGATCAAGVRADAGRAQLIVSRPGASQLTVDVPGDVQFRYGDAGGVSNAWPSQAGRPLELQTVSLFETGGSGFPIATVRLAIDEPPGCVFDVVAQACRLSP